MKIEYKGFYFYIGLNGCLLEIDFKFRKYIYCIHLGFLWGRWKDWED